MSIDMALVASICKKITIQTQLQVQNGDLVDT